MSEVKFWASAESIALSAYQATTSLNKAKFKRALDKLNKLERYHRREQFVLINTVDKQPMSPLKRKLSQAEADVLNKNLVSFNNKWVPDLSNL